MLGHDTVEGGHVLEGATHEQRVVHAVPVVAEDPDARGRPCHRADLGELLAPEAERHGADGTHLGVAVALAEPLHLLHDACGVGDGRGVRHGVHGREPSSGRRTGAREHRLAGLSPGLAQMGVQVDEAGQGDEPAGVDHALVRLGRERAAGGDETVADADVVDVRAEEGGAADQEAGHPSPPVASGEPVDPATSR